jgi:hypothetical protein
VVPVHSIGSCLDSSVVSWATKFTYWALGSGRACIGNSALAAVDSTTSPCRFGFVQLLSSRETPNEDGTSLRVDEGREAKTLPSASCRAKGLAMRFCEEEMWLELKIVAETEEDAKRIWATRVELCGTMARSTSHAAKHVDALRSLPPRRVARARRHRERP